MGHQSQDAKPYLRLAALLARNVGFSHGVKFRWLVYDANSKFKWVTNLELTTIIADKKPVVEGMTCSSIDIISGTKSDYLLNYPLLPFR